MSTTAAFREVCAFENLLDAFTKAARGKRARVAVSAFEFRLTDELFIVYPTHRRVNARKVRLATRRLRGRVEEHNSGRISFAELDASVQGWINHVRYANTWGLRTHLFGQSWFRLRPRAQPEEEEEHAPQRVGSIARRVSGPADQ